MCLANFRVFLNLLSFVWLLCRLLHCNLSCFLCNSGGVYYGVKTNKLLHVKSVWQFFLLKLWASRKYVTWYICDINHCYFVYMLVCFKKYLLLNSQVDIIYCWWQPSKKIKKIREREREIAWVNVIFLFCSFAFNLLFSRLWLFEVLKCFR